MPGITVDSLSRMDAPLDLSDLPAGLAARSVTWDDVDAVTELVAACELFDDGAAEVHREDILADWNRPSFDAARRASP